MELVRWCAFCNERASAGTLTVEEKISGEMSLPACQVCVDKIYAEQDQLMFEF